MQIEIDRDQYLELEKLALGVFKPLNGFMNENDFNSCVESLSLASGEVFPLPVVFDISADRLNEIKNVKEVHLSHHGEQVGILYPQSVYRPEKAKCLEKVFGTADTAHPGVKHFLGLGEYFVGGEVKLLKRPKFEFAQYELTPEQTKKCFQDLGWKTIVGFQTRNVPHRAHEYLQKVALETVDGILIQPLVGKKKPGDYSPLAVIRGYEALVENFYPQGRAKLAVLSTVMRYAGPREAIFHAIVRRNYGCTHFIVGRDHAGVGNYYGKYAAHELISKYESRLGIQIMKLSGPYYCESCSSIATEKTCPHFVSEPNACIEISGTLMRKMIASGADVDRRFMRPEVIKALKGIDVFIEAK